MSGRPRSQETRRALLDAAFAHLAERGYAGLTIEAVARAAGAGKTTIYRRWKTKAELAVDAFFEATEAGLRFPDTGSAREDFSQQIRELAALLQGPLGEVFKAMLVGALADRELAQALGERWLAPRQAWGFERITRAIALGQCRPGVTPGPALGLLYGPLYTPLMFGRGFPGPVEVEAHLGLVLEAIFV